MQYIRFNIPVLLFLIFVCTGTSYSQVFRGTILDSESGQPIPLAEIYFIDLKTGTVANENGEFAIKPFAHRNIHVQITSIGYNTLDEFIIIDTLKQHIFYLQPGHYELEEVIVSVPGQKLQGENVVGVEHASMYELHQTATLSLMEAISQVAGVEQIATGVGIGKPVIRGLSGNRVVTFAQGIRIENQQWGDEHGLGIGEIGIESVEVIKGPASLLYGSDALGGILYFVDERYAKHNSFEIAAASKFHSNTLGSINSFASKLNKGSLKLNLFGSYSSHVDYKTPMMDRVINSRFDEKNIKGSFGFNTKNWISNVRYSFLNNRYGITEDAIFISEKERNFELPFQNIDNHNLTWENTLFIDESKLKINLGYSHNYRQEFEDDKDVHALGLRLNTYTYNLKWHSPTYNKKVGFIIGSQGMQQANENNGEEILIPDSEIRDFGLFGMATLDLAEFYLQGGIRVDYRSIDTEHMETDESIFPALSESYNGITYSLGALYKLDKITLRANVSSGFRAPNTSELLSNGVHEGTIRYELGNSSLTSEKAVQLDLAIEYEDEHISIFANPFYNSIQNYIFLSPRMEFIDNYPVFEFMQTDASLYGGEVGFHFHPHQIHWLHIESNLSTVFAEDKDENSLPLVPQSGISSSIRAALPAKGNVKLKSVFLKHIYKFEQDRVSLFETMSESYSLIDIGFDIEILTKNVTIEIDTGVKNLFNNSYTDHLSRFKNLGIPNQGINFYMGLNFSISNDL